MSQLLETYTSLTYDSPRSSVSSVLRDIANAPPTVDSTSSSTLLKVILDDLKTCIIDGAAGRLSKEDAAPALLAVKMMGRNQVGCLVVSHSQNLSTLLTITTNFRNAPDVSNEAMKCVANTLLLNESSRSSWVGKQIGGGDVCVDILEKSTVPEEIFLMSRILFLCTASPTSAGQYIQDLVETKRPGNVTIIDIIGVKLDTLTRCIQTGVKMSREAMTDLLKFTFNLLVHYPKIVECESQSMSPSNDPKSVKVMGDFWSHRLDGILPPLLRVFNSLPLTSPNPLTSPLTHTIHSLITIPIPGPLRTVWFGKNSSNTQSPLNSRSPSNSSNSSPTTSTKFPLPSSSKGSESPTGKIGAIDRALSSVLAAGRRSLSRSLSPSSPHLDTVSHAYNLLDVTLAYFLPGNIDTDHSSVRELCARENESSLDDILSPLVLLLTRFSIADEGVRTRIRECLVPSDLDRTVPLESRSDILGRCLRLLGCVYHPRLKDAVGEMLYALCDSDATTLSGYFGYGNVAGFLFHKGIMNAPEGSTSTAPQKTSSGDIINPITGVVEREMPEVQMTPEEKEREADRLFELFDRLEKTGAMPPSQNPMRKAIQEGKLQFGN